MVTGRGIGATGLLEKAASGLVAFGIAHRSSPSSSEKFSGGHPVGADISRGVGWIAASLSTGKCDLVHDVAGSLSSVVSALQWSRRPYCGNAHCQSQSCRNRRIDRLLCEHTDIAHGSLRQSHICAGAPKSARSLPGSLCEPGYSIRESGRRTGTAAGPEPYSALPSHVRPAKCSCRGWTEGS